MRILVACVGNIFLGDDGFGVAVAERLHRRRLPEGVLVIDFGIRGIDLAYTLLDDYDALVLVDAVPRGGAPGTLYLIDPEVPVAGPDAGGVVLDSHSMDPVKVLAFARALGAPTIRTLVVGCEPSPTPSDDVQMPVGLSAPVCDAIDEAVALIERVVQHLCPSGERS